MAQVEVSRTLVKSPPELWTELQGDRLTEVAGDVTVRVVDPERRLEWEGSGARGSATIEPSGWGTKLTLTAEIEERVAQFGLWSRMWGEPRPEPELDPGEVERRLEGLLDTLGSAHRKPFTRG